jgi:hypothetical protein
VTNEPHGYYLDKPNRQHRLALIAKQVERGELLIRQATDAEREAWAREREQREDQPATDA